MRKLTSTAAKQLKQLRQEQINTLARTAGLDTREGIEEYFTHTATNQTLLVASLDEEGYHLTTDYAVRYQAWQTKALMGDNDIYLSKQFLSQYGYSDHQGWPVALMVDITVPVLAQEKPKPDKTAKTGKVNKTPEQSVLDKHPKPKKPWKETSAKARTVLRDLANELENDDIGPEDARELARELLIAKQYMAKQ